MKILVIEENEHDRKAAEILLGSDEHQITIVSSLTEAKKALCVRSNEEFVKNEMAKLGAYNQHRDKQEWNRRKCEINEQSYIYPDFDVVLTSLMLQSDSWPITSLPLGLTVALNALSVGIKKVAVVASHDEPYQLLEEWSDADRDSLVSSGYPLEIGDAEVLIFPSNSTLLHPQTFEEVRYESPRPPTREENQRGWYHHDAPKYDVSDPNLICVKAWHEALEKLLRRHKLAEYQRINKSEETPKPQNFFRK